MQVLHHHDQWLSLALLQEQLVQRGKGLEADRLGAAPDARCRAIGHAEQGQQDRGRFGGRQAERLEMQLHGGGDHGRAVHLGETTGVP